MSKLKFIFTILIVFAFAGIASAQDFPDDQPRSNQKRQRPNLLRELDLSPEQVEQIREINQNNRLELRRAQQKVGEARRDLDQAIYAEKVDETNVQKKLREFQNAQAEAARLRADTEFQIRKVLTPEQLIRFRELREDFGQFRNNRRQNPNNFRMRNQFRNKRFNNRQASPQN